MKYHYIPCLFAKTHNYSIFIAKIYYCGLIDSFTGSAGLIDSPTSYATLGKGGATKSDEFLEKFQRWGGGSFSIQEFISQILDLYKGPFVNVFRKKGGSFGIFLKIHPIW